MSRAFLTVRRREASKQGILTDQTKPVLDINQMYDPNVTLNSQAMMDRTQEIRTLDPYVGLLRSLHDRAFLMHSF